MPLVQLTLDQLLEAIRQLTPEELALLDAQLSQMRRDRLRSLTQTVRQRTQEASPAELDEAVEIALRAVRSSAQ